MYHPSEYRRLNYKNRHITRRDVEKILKTYHGETIVPINISLYQYALTHKSYLRLDVRVTKNLDKTGTPCMRAMENDIRQRKLVGLQRYCNERLEYLGDAEIYSAVAHYLYCRYPEQNEGFMSQMRIKLIKGEALAKLAKHIGLDQFILLSNHQESIGGRENKNLLENVMESFIGAIVMDLGIHRSRSIFMKMVEQHIDFATLSRTNTNYKDVLLRYYQARAWGHPKYRQCKTNDEEKPQGFVMQLLDRYGQIVSSGAGKNKKEAEQVASKNGLQKFGALKTISQEPMTIL